MSAIITQLRREMGLEYGDDPQIEEIKRWMKEVENHPVDNSWIFERAKELSAQVPMEEWEELPPDYSVNLDHYLYGTPKQVDEP